MVHYFTEADLLTSTIKYNCSYISILVLGEPFFHCAFSVAFSVCVNVKYIQILVIITLKALLEILFCSNFNALSLSNSY